MVAIVATSQKSRKRGSSLPFECRHALGESRTLPHSACMASSCIGRGSGWFSGHGHHSHPKLNLEK
jgi:hypothetical protein